MKKFLVFCIGFIVNIPFLSDKVKDFLMWPVATRLLGPRYIQKVKMRDGFLMYGSMEDILSRRVMFSGPFKKNIWEPSTSQLLENLSKKSNNIIIAGSHIGYLVLKSARSTSGQVHAFEPISYLYERSLNNFDLNPSLKKKIILTNSALGDSVGELKLYSEDIRSSAIAYSGGHVNHQNIVTAPLTTIDSYAQNHQIASVDLIVLDVEGFEANVIHGAKKTMLDGPDLILEISPRVLAHTDMTPTQFVKVILELGYVLFFIDDYSELFSLVSYSPDQAKRFFKRDYVNIYATRKQPEFL